MISSKCERPRKVKETFEERVSMPLKYVKETSQAATGLNQERQSQSMNEHWYWCQKKNFLAKLTSVFSRILSIKRQHTSL